MSLRILKIICVSVRKPDILVIIYEAYLNMFFFEQMISTEDDIHQVSQPHVYRKKKQPTGAQTKLTTTDPKVKRTGVKRDPQWIIAAANLESFHKPSNSTSWADSTMAGPTFFSHPWLLSWRWRTNKTKDDEIRAQTCHNPHLKLVQPTNRLIVSQIYTPLKLVNHSYRHFNIREIVVTPHAQPSSSTYPPRLVHSGLSWVPIDVLLEFNAVEKVPLRIRRCQSVEPGRSKSN